MSDDDHAPLSLANLQQLVHLLEFPERDNLVGILSVSTNEVVVLKPIELTKSGWSVENERKRVTKLLKRVRQLGKFKIRMALGDYFVAYLKSLGKWNKSKNRLIYYCKRTTKVFAQNCDACQTCQTLHIHRNTLRYRLERIEEITSLNINNLDDKLHLYLALKLFGH